MKFNRIWPFLVGFSFFAWVTAVCVYGYAQTAWRGMLHNYPPDRTASVMKFWGTGAAVSFMIALGFMLIVIRQLRKLRQSN